MTTPLRTRAALLLPALLLVGGCSLGGGPEGAAAPAPIDAAALPAGGCQTAAPLLQQVREDVAELRADAGTEAAVRGRLAASQAALDGLPVTGQGSAGALTELGQAIGFLRLGIDTHSYEDSHLSRVDDAVTGTLDACMAG